VKPRHFIFVLGFISSLFGGSSKPQAIAAEPRAAANMFNPAKIYPYVVPASYLEHQSAKPEGLTYALGHGLYVTLVQDHDGLAGSVRGEDLATAKLSPKEAHARAVENLVALVKSGAITMRLYKGPQQKPFILFTDHWLAAACVTLPDLRTLATKNLGTESFCVCLPQRDSMLLFPSVDKAFRAEMVSVIRKNEADARKPLSFGLFQLDPTGLHEFKDAE
jgi:hypothetical protein